MRNSMKKLLVMMCVMMFSLMLAIPAQAAGVKLNKRKVTLTAGSAVTLKVKGTSKKAAWKSSNKKVAAVSNKGVVKGKSQGTAVITAKVAGKKLTCKVTVKRPSTKVSRTGSAVNNGVAYKLTLKSDGILYVEIKNKSQYDISLGWAGNFVAVYGLSSGNVSAGLDVLNSLQYSGDLNFNRVASGTTRTYYANLSSLRGTLKQVTLRNITPLETNGLPVFDRDSFSYAAYTVNIPMK